MKRSFLIVLSLLLLTPVLASPGFSDPEFRSFVTEFLANFAPELAALSMAAVASIGLQLALKRYGKMFEGDDRSMNVVTVVIFISLFLMIYTSQLYLFFIPFMGYLVITGFGAILFSVVKGLGEGGLKPFDKIIGAAGCFFLSWFAFMAGPTLYWVGFLMLIMGIVLLMMGLPELGGLFNKLGGGEGGLFSKKKTEPTDEIVDENIASVPTSGDELDATIDKSEEAVQDGVKLLTKTGEDISGLLNNVFSEIKGGSV